MIKRGLGALTLIGVLASAPIQIVFAQDDGGGFDDSEGQDDPDGDIAVGELGSVDDDTDVPNAGGAKVGGKKAGGVRTGGGRRARARAPVSPPRAVIDPQIRIAVARKFSKEMSAELYGRMRLGAIRDPLETKSTVAAAGVILNRNINGFVWSNSVEIGEHYRDFYDRHVFEAYEVTTALAHPIKLGATAWTLTPRVSYSYQWASDRRYERSKMEFMAPLSYKLTKQIDLTLMQRIDWQVYTDRPDGRRDFTGYIAPGVKYEVIKGVNMTLSLGYETRASNVATFNFTRLKFAPQINIRADL